MAARQISTSSCVWSAFGPVTQSGFRLKLDGLADIYGETDASPSPATICCRRSERVTDLMIGYQFEYGPAWIKLYAGAAYAVQTRIINIVYYTDFVDQRGRRKPSAPRRHSKAIGQ